MMSWGAARFALFSSEVGRKREIPEETLVRLRGDDPVHVPDAGVWLAKRGGDSEVLALDDRCTHLGCRYKWNASPGQFDCPCHGSSFSIEGDVTRGPASQPLRRLSILRKPGENARLVDAPRR
ncbi:MAG: Rieske 2Fe-2S domain-containing protein [Thermodesulfobacteriota bacterium]